MPNAYPTKKLKDAYRELILQHGIFPSSIKTPATRNMALLLVLTGEVEIGEPSENAAAKDLAILGYARY